MRRTLIACHRPKPGQAEALRTLLGTHHARLYEQGLVTRRAPVVTQARDGTLLELLEWKSPRAIDQARESPAARALQTQLAAVSDSVPIATLAEAAEDFSSFESIDLRFERPAFSKVYNHVQIDARIATSGALTADAVTEMAQRGYRAVINLLPDDSEHALADEARLMTERGLAYHYIPVDFAAPSAADYAAFVSAMRASDPATKLFVHCAANMRVSAFMARYGREHLGWSAERAAEHLAEIWQPDATWQKFLAG